MRIRQPGFLYAVVWFATALVLLIAVPASAQKPTTSDEPLSDRRVAYTIDASLDVDTRTINGIQRLRWRNPDSVPVDEIQFHLYLNAFRDENSTFMRESGGQHRGFSASAEDRWGGVTVDRIERVYSETDATMDPGARAGDRVDLTADLRFIQPDDGNPDDRTVAALSLDRPVQPGAWIEFEMEFTSKLPQIVARTGWARTEDGSVFVMAAQWFPKVGVLEIPGQRYVPADAERGVWNTHQFHANSEFYADFGTYDVTITVPDDYVVGATGIRVNEGQSGLPGDAGSREAGARTTVRYLAEDVHDFAWTASPSFLEFEQTWRHVNLRLLLRPEHRGQAQRHFDAAITALEYFDEWVGPYPYTTLTLVDGYGGANGMEYPTLITCGTFYGLPKWLRFLELVTIHEFGHQYFYGMLASNEFEEAWLDEGMNSFLETRIMDAAYGDGALMDFPGLPVGSVTQHKLTYSENNPSSGALFTNSWAYAAGDFGKASYSKPATVMNALQWYLGFDRMTEFLKLYYDRWAFRHPTTRDVQAVAEEVAGEDLDWFFDQYVYGTAVLDYELASIEVNPPDESGAVGTSSLFTSTVLARRLGDGYFPTTLRVTFSDGSTRDVAWDGRAAERRFIFEEPVAVMEAFLDPEHRVPLDINRVNDRRVTQPRNPFATKLQLRITTWTQQIAYLLAGIL